MITLARLISNIFSSIFSGAEPQESGYRMSDTTQQATAAAVEAATDRVPVEMLATSGSDKIRLVQVLLDGTLPPEHKADTIVCLNVHENNNALSAAAEYARRVRAVEPGGEIRPTPSIFALVNIRALSPEELWLVNKRLIPAGVSIFEYPKGCSSFREAMVALGKEVVAAHQTHNSLRRRSSISSLLDQAIGRVSVGAAADSSASAVGQTRASARLKASAAE